MTDSDDTPRDLIGSCGLALGTGTAHAGGRAAPSPTRPPRSSSVTCTDDGTLTLTLTADDGTNPPVADSLLLTIANAQPGRRAPGADQAARGGRDPREPCTPATPSATPARTTPTQRKDRLGRRHRRRRLRHRRHRAPCRAAMRMAPPARHTVTVTVTDDDTGAGLRHPHRITKPLARCPTTRRSWPRAPTAAGTEG